MSQRNLKDTASGASLDESMGYLVRRTFQAFTRGLEQRLAPHGVSISMWFFLRLLWERDGLSQKEISHELGLTQPTTVAAMDNLEGRGLIRRHRNLDDRRKVNIHLTPAGTALREVLAPFATEVNAVALTDFTDVERETLQRLLLRVNAALAADRDAARTNARATK